MSSRLASLLVQEALVAPKKMAEAFQRQVIYGGTLDTILLEMNVLDEAVLVEAMGRASGLPTAGDLPSQEQLDAADAKSWFSHALSERYRAVPVSLDGNVVRVLVTDPPDRKQLDELGYHLSRSVDPIVVPEHRFAHAVELVYGVSVPARFASLAAKLRQRASEAPPKPAERSAAPRPERADRPERVVQIEAEPADEPHDTVEMPTFGARETVRLPAVEARGTISTPEINGAQPPDGNGHRTVVTDVPMPESHAPAAPMPEDPTPRLTPRQADAPLAISPELTVQRVGNASADAAPLSLEHAALAVEAAGDRDAIFEALCRGARSQLEFVALLMVHGDLAVGRLALDDAGGWMARDAIAALSLSLEAPSAFRTVVQSKSPYLGRLGEEGPGAQALGMLGRKPPVPALLLPIVLRERTVALLYGDAGGRSLEAATLGELSTLVGAAARSFQRLIFKQKGADFSRARPDPSAAAKVTGPLHAAAAGGDWQPANGEEDARAKARPTIKGFAALSNAVMETIHDQPTQAVPEGPAMTDAEALVASVMREDAHASAAAESLLLLGERGAQAAVAQLPGPLRLDRHALRGPAPELAAHGPLLSVIARFGQAALVPLIARLADDSLEVRYYATLALGDLRAARSVPALGQRLLDPDAGVRHAAVGALARMEETPELRHLTESLRGELPGPEPFRQRYAAEALGALHDVPSVPRLIELVKHTDAQVVTAARRALIEITKQDFGTSRWRWRGWWERHRSQPRVEWMLEGLGHAESDVRMSASEELRALSREHFGYQFDLPKREREEARRKWIDWWRTHGHKQQGRQPEER